MNSALLSKANQVRVLGSAQAVGFRGKVPVSFTIWALALYRKVLFGDQIRYCSNNLTSQSALYASTCRIHPFFLNLA